MGENEQVSKRRYDPPTPPPQAVTRALDGFGVSTIRTEILRSLALNEAGRTTTEIAEQVDADRRTVWKHLRELRDLGWVLAVVPESGDQLHIVFRLNASEILAANERAMNYTLGQDDKL